MSFLLVQSKQFMVFWSLEVDRRTKKAREFVDKGDTFDISFLQLTPWLIEYLKGKKAWRKRYQYRKNIMDLKVHVENRVWKIFEISFQNSNLRLAIVICIYNCIRVIYANRILARRVKCFFDSLRAVFCAQLTSNHGADDRYRSKQWVYGIDSGNCCNHSPH